MYLQRISLIALSLSLILPLPVKSEVVAPANSDQQQRQTAPATPDTNSGAPADNGTAPAAAANSSSGADSTNGNKNNKTSRKKRDTASGTSPIVIPPTSFVDLTTARFSRLDIDLEQAAFLEAKVRDFRLVAENMDMNKGTLEMLSVQFDDGAFQNFNIDSLHMWTRGSMQFDTQKLLNQKILQFSHPATARVRVSVSQNSLNKFINAPFVLTRLSDAARKRVPILSSLAKQDINFGFSFLRGDLRLEPENRIKLSMDTKLGLNKVGMPVNVSVQTQLKLADGWVSLADTKLQTGGHAVPKDLSAKVVDRFNSLSDWGSRSDDIKFEFTELVVLPDERIELEGTAIINRLRFARSQESESDSNSRSENNEPVQTEIHPAIEMR